MARPSSPSFCALLLAAAALLPAARGFVPPTPAVSKPSSTKLEVARLDLYPGLKVRWLHCLDGCMHGACEETGGWTLTHTHTRTPRTPRLGVTQGIFEMGNIILDEVRAGGKEARQDMQELKKDLFAKREDGAAAAAVAAVPKPEVHPIYGELVKDLVYKKGACVGRFNLRPLADSLTD